ncbi:MAG: hypothetical protein AB7Q76_17475 [Gammaproteobacteria bacterium]
MNTHIPRLAWFGLALALNVSLAHAAEFWTGPRITFTRANNSANPLLPENQDRITDGIWITRGTTAGLFNAHSETGYSGFSPAGTEWVFGRSLADGIDGVTFKPWVEAAGRNPPATVGVNAVVHLIADDIYIDVKFTQWNITCCGGFAYERSTPALPPAENVAQVPLLPWPALAGLGGLLAAVGWRRQAQARRARR